MDSDFYWETFLKTGKVSDYINYKRSCTNAVTEDYAAKDGWIDHRPKEDR